MVAPPAPRSAHLSCHGRNWSPHRFLASRRGRLVQGYLGRTCTAHGPYTRWAKSRVLPPTVRPRQHAPILARATTWASAGERLEGILGEPGGRLFRLRHDPCPSRGRLGLAASRLLACLRRCCTRKLRGLRLRALLLEPQPLRSTAVSASQLEQQHDLPSRRPLRGAAERRRRHRYRRLQGFLWAKKT